MSEILIESLGTSRYAPVNINAYQYNGLAGLSFGQLIMAVCCRRAAAIESQSVIKMNQLTQTTGFLNEASAVTARIFTASSVSEADKIFMEKEMGVEESDIDISSYDKRMALFSKLKGKLDDATNESQELTIALQSLVSRRDVTYNTSAATVKALLQSAMSQAAAIG